MEVGTIGCGVEEHQDGRIQSAAFNGPHGVCKDNAGNIFVADAYNQCVRPSASFTSPILGGNFFQK